MKLSFPQRLTSLSQALKFLQCETQGYSELFTKLNKHNMVKTKLRLIQRLCPPAKDELNSTLEVQHGVGHQFSANSLQNRKCSDSNEIQALKEILELAINDRLLTVPAKNNKK